jgi:hypothetical protein
MITLKDVAKILDTSTEVATTPAALEAIAVSFRMNSLSSEPRGRKRRFAEGSSEIGISESDRMEEFAGKGESKPMEMFAGASPSFFAEQNSSHGFLS